MPTDFKECPLYEKAHNDLGQTEEMHGMLVVMKETLKWHKIIGYCFIIAFLTLGAFVLNEARNNTKMFTAFMGTQKGISDSIKGQSDSIKTQSRNMELLNKNIVESSLMNVNLTADYMLKLARYEIGLKEANDEIQKNTNLLNRNYGRIQAMSSGEEDE